MTKCILPILITITLLGSTQAQNMVPNEILQTVFLIKHAGNSGTCFLVSIDSNDYLITAKHLFPDSTAFNSTVDIEIYNNQGWKKFKPNILFHDNPSIDIAVLNLKSNDFKHMAFDVGSKWKFRTN